MGFPARRRFTLSVAALTLAAFAGGAAADHGVGGGGGGPPAHAGGPGGLGPGNHGKHKGRPVRALGTLLPPEGAADEDALARVDVKFFPAVGRRAERSWLKIKARRLDAATEYSLWADDGSGTLAQFGTATTNDMGAFNFAADTRHEGTLPFDATLDALGGAALEVRSADGTTTVLAGTIPDITP